MCLRTALIGLTEAIMCGNQCEIAIAKLVCVSGVVVVIVVVMKDE